MSKMNNSAHSLSEWLRLLLLQEHHSLGGLNNKHLLLRVLEAGKPWSQCWQFSVSGEDSLPGSQMAISSLCPQVAEGVLLSLLHKNSNTVLESSTSGPKQL